MSERPADANGRAADGGRPAAPGERPPKRLLEVAPSERLATGQVRSARPAANDGSRGRAVGYGLVAAAAGMLVHVVAATLLLWTGALLVVAVTIGIIVGLAVAVGAGRSLQPRSRRGLAVGLSIGSLVLAVGLDWAASGMYLGPLDYAAQVYGLLVPLEIVLAAAGAFAGSR